MGPQVTEITVWKGYHDRSPSLLYAPLKLFPYPRDPHAA
jgi:hypothetical protein